MGQEPNMPLEIEDLPRATPKPETPRRWSPSRPGEVGSPDDMPWGGLFGTPSPDTGYALKVVRGRELPGAAGGRADVEAAVVAVMAARASAIGRAPTGPDVDVALDLLGLPSDEGLARLDGVAHDRRRLARIVSGIPMEQLTRT